MQRMGSNCKVRFHITLVFGCWIFSISSIAQIAPKHAAQVSNGIKFFENKGQWDERIEHKADLPSGTLLLTESALVYSFFETDKVQGYLAESHQGMLDHTKDNLYWEHVYHVEFVNANKRIETSSSKPYPTQYNYFIGNDQKHWASGVQSYQEVTYHNLWNHIDLKLYSFYNTIKYEFIVYPGGNPDDIQLKYNGVDSLSIMSDGALKIETKVTTIRDHAPYSYQVFGKEKLDVNSSYKLVGDIQSFEIGAYNLATTLVIDPQLIFSTYSGSTADNWGNTACLDSIGNLYTGGTVFKYRSSSSPTTGNGQFPATPGAYQRSFRAGDTDIGLLKFDSSGTSLLAATYVGGIGTEIPVSTVYDENSRELVVFATTSSPDFPLNRNSFQREFGGGTSITNGPVGGYSFPGGTDMVVFKMSEDFSTLTRSTYIGGSSNDGILLERTTSGVVHNYGDQLRGDVNVDEEGFIYIGSMTQSRDFPTVNPLQGTYAGGLYDAVVCKLNPELSDMVWSTYVGGTQSDVAFSIQFDSLKNVLIAGGTQSTDFPTTPGVYQETFNGNVDAFIARIQNDGSRLVASTFVGTTSFDQAYFVQQDSEYNVYILGQTRGVVPIIPASAFHVDNTGILVQKFTYDLDSLTYSTTIGSANSNPLNVIPNISPTAFLVNECGHLLIAGWGGTTNYLSSNTRGMPLSTNAYQSTTDGSDFYFAVIDQFEHDLLYATYFGGPNSVEHVDGGTSRFDKRGIIYQSVCAGCSPCQGCPGGLDDFPIFPPVDGNPNTYPQENNSLNCNNGVIKFDLSSLLASINSENICVEDEITFQNNTVGGETFTWVFGDGSDTLVLEEKVPVTHRYDNLGQYLVTLIVEDISTCKRFDTVFFDVRVFEPKDPDHIFDTLCLDEERRISAATFPDDDTYLWEPDSNLSSAVIPNPIVTGVDTIRYLVTITDTIGCERIDTVDIFVPIFGVEFESELIRSCLLENPTQLNILEVSEGNLEDGQARCYWSFGNGDTSFADLPSYEFTDPGTYQVRRYCEYLGCFADSVIQVEVPDVDIPNIFTPNGDGSNDAFRIFGLNDDEGWRFELYNRWGKRVYRDENYKNDYTAQDIEDGTYYYLITSPDGTKCKNWVQITR